MNTVKAPLITVLTPSYNRADYLPKLYMSLIHQTNYDFIWLVVDDGSTDDTEQFIEHCIGENRISIKYIKQDNGGKHRALNNGIGMISSELTFIVDSDDFLPEDAISIICNYHKKYSEAYDVISGKRKEYDKENDIDTNQICGYSFLRCHEDGTVNTAFFPSDELVDTFQNVRINGKIGGDKAEVFFTAILKKFPFPEIQGEKFLPEDIVWMRMSGPYKMVHINKNVYYCEYQEGGLTKTGHSMKVHSPKGMMLRSEIYLSSKGVSKTVRLKMMMLYIIYGRFANMKYRELKNGIAKSILWYICFVPAQIMYFKWNRESKE